MAPKNKKKKKVEKTPEQLEFIRLKKERRKIQVQEKQKQIREMINAKKQKQEENRQQQILKSKIVNDEN